jgi:hypothetical protein
MNYIIELQSKEHKTNNLDASTKKKTRKSLDLGRTTSVQSEDRGPERDTTHNDKWSEDATAHGGQEAGYRYTEAMDA